MLTKDQICKKFLSNPKINQACNMVREVMIDQLKQNQDLAGTIQL